MTPMHDHDERTLGSLFDEWRADEPSAGFALGVIRAARPAAAVTSTRWTARGVVVPVLLAALLVSFGAAAFSQREVRSGLKNSLEETDARHPSMKAAPIAFQFPEEAGQAEPDWVDSKPRVKEPNPKPIAQPAFLTEVEVPVVAPPRVVHFPHCECGTSGVVCSCSD